LSSLYRVSLRCRSLTNYGAGIARERVVRDVRPPVRRVQGSGPTPERLARSLLSFLRHLLRWSATERSPAGAGPTSSSLARSVGACPRPPGAGHQLRPSCVQHLRVLCDLINLSSGARPLVPPGLPSGG